MEPNYPPGFYCTERDQQERHQPSQQQQQPQQQQQQQQHAAHYPFDLPIPYHTTSQHQSAYVEDQPTRVFPAPHPGPMAPAFSSIFHDPSPVHSTSNHLHLAHHQRPVTFGGHGVKFSTLSANYASPITTHEEAIERNNLPITTQERRIKVVERNKSPTTTHKSDVESIVPLTKTHESAVESNIPAATTCEIVKDSHIMPVTTPEVVTEKIVPPVKIQGTAAEGKIRLLTSRKPHTDGNTSNQPGSAPGPSKEGQSKEGTDQRSASPSSPRSSAEEPQLLAALNLRKSSSVRDLPSSLSLRVASQDKVEGVVAKETIEKGVEFGPYTGTLMNEELGWSKDTSWEICISGLVFFYIDGCKTWMSHVRCARNEDEQNMEAYQYCGEIYFRSTKVIEPGGELKVFYSGDYGKCAGILTRLKDLRLNEDAQKFQCSQCEGLFTSAKLILRHIRFEHNSNKQDEMIPVLTWKKKRKKKYVAIEVSSKQQITPMVKVNDQEESVFKCGTCTKLFSSFGRLKAHELFHEKEQASAVHDKAPPTPSKQTIIQRSKWYECSECNKGFKLWRLLYRHEREVHGYQCQFCLERFTKKNECVKHEKTHQAFKSSQTQASPTKTRASSAGIQPSEPAPDEAKDMLGRPSNYYQRRYKCRFCTKRYSAKSTAERHEKEVHTGEGDFKCNYCPKVFATASRLKDHLVLHKYVNMYRCTLCPRSFASESALNNHQGEHTGLKPFKCEVCGRGFRTRKLALSHKRRIHQERPKRFVCTFCGKGFADKNDLKVHERRHKGIRQYVCLECGRGFTSSTSLAAHTQAMHIKEKPFSCEICGKAFALNHQYNHHMAKHRLEGEVRDDNVFRTASSMQQQ